MSKCPSFATCPTFLLVSHVNWLQFQMRNHALSWNMGKKVTFSFDFYLKALRPCSHWEAASLEETLTQDPASLRMNPTIFRQSIRMVSSP